MACIAIAACGWSPGNDSEPDPIPVPVNVDTIHVVLTFSPDGTAMNNYPRTVSGPLTLRVASNGDVTGSLAILPSTDLLGPPISQAPISGRFTGGQLTLDPGQVDLDAETSVTWARFTITVGPAGLIEGGVGTMTGMWQTIDGDALDGGGYRVKLLAIADTWGSSITLAYTDPVSRDPWLPTDGLSLQLGEPADASQAANLRVLANDVPVAGALSPVTPVDGRVTAMTFHPAGFWPFGSVISTDPNGLTDPSGNPFTARALRNTIVADPGPITANLGFESATSGWLIRKGAAAGVAPSIDTIDPVEGASQMVVADNSTVEGYFDVASDATSLSMSVALLLTDGPLDDYRAAAVALRRANGERVVVYDAAVEHTRSIPCDCGGFVARVPPAKKTVDLTPYRGERLFVVAEVKSFDGGFVPPAPLVLVLDDLRIQ